jgi:hypothetical protein
MKSTNPGRQRLGYAHIVPLERARTFIIKNHSLYVIQTTTYTASEQRRVEKKEAR